MKVRILHCFLCNLLLTLTFICFGCQDQELVQSGESTDAIAFALYNNSEDTPSSSPLTRTSEKPLVLYNEDGTDSLTFYLTITDAIDMRRSSYQSDTVISRGTPITQENLKTECSGEIALDAFYQNTPYIKDEILFNANGDAHTRITRYWPATQGAKVAFWSYHPKEIAVATEFEFINETTIQSNPSLSFYYDQFDAINNKLIDVTRQKDLFFAYVYQGREDGVVKLNYEHALSAIKFIAGKTLAGTVTNITLTNICSGGTLTYKPKATPALNWELDDESFTTLDQGFNVELDENLTGAPSQAITNDGEGTTFLLIPQPVNPEGVADDKLMKLSITFKRLDGEEVVYSATMPEGEWQMGKTYTYSLKLMDGLGIDATDEANGAKIDGVVIKNTNKKSCYIRAMIIGNWVDAEGNVAAIFNPEEIDLKIPSNTNYECDTNWGDNWYYDTTDNLYYYKKLLPKDGQIKLFNKFKYTNNRIDGLKLDFVVLVQAVEADTNKVSVKEAWGNDIASLLESLN